MAETLSVDICVIGGGSGGLTVAAAAAAFGVPTVLIERGRMGGDCLNYGCVPSKALIAAARQAAAIAAAGDFGIVAGPVAVDFGRVRAHVQATIAAIAPTDSAERFSALGVRVLRDHARFVDRRTVEAGQVRIRARRFVVATGSSPRIPDIPGLDTVDYQTNETIFDLKILPPHLAVLGGGSVGIELAQAFRRLGAAVTVIDVGPALSAQDPEAAALVLRHLRGGGVVIHETTTVQAVERAGGAIRLVCAGAQGRFELDCSHLLVAAGRRPNIDGLGLAAAGVRSTAQGITVGSGLRSSNRRIYAIGDVIGGLQFTHAAGYHAKIVLPQILLRLPSRENRDIVPKLLFTDPEIACIGLDAEAARRRHGTIRILRWPYAENDRAQAERRTSGFIKVIADRKARILGVVIVGEAAAEMINFWSLAMARRLRLKDIRDHVPAYPTYSEIGKRAAVAYYQPLARVPWIRSLVRFLSRFR